METSPLFLKARIWAFLIIILVSLAWITLLSIEAFTRWSLSTNPERSFLVLIFSVNLLSVFMLPVLLILEFRAWLDGARIGLLLVAHIGTAGTYSFWFPQLQCASDDGDGAGVCQLTNMFTLMGCWINPILLITYASCLTLMVCRRRTRLAAETLEAAPSDSDVEATKIRASTLPMMNPNDQRHYSFSTTRTSLPPPDRKSSQTTLSSDMREVVRKSARLSKPLPVTFWAI